MIPDVPNPFGTLAGEAGKIIADAWTVAMLGLWNAGLWVFRLVLRLVDALTTPDISEHGPAHAVYQVTFWMAGALLLVLVMVQLGVAAVRRDAKSLATVFWGVARFVVVWAGWVGYGVAVVAACGGLTRALMLTLLRVGSWSAWQPWAPFTVSDGVDGTVATVLGLLGLLLWLAAIGHLLVMLTRGGALLVLAATAPISAAGLVGEAGRSWFWKSLRWFHAAAFTPVLMVLVLGVGVQMTTGVGNGLAGTPQAAVGTALPGVVMVLVGCFAPLGLFKLLAFVEPGTSSGAALRQGLAAHGGIQGLITGGAGKASAGTGSDAASMVTDGQGRSMGEAAGEDSTSARFTQAQTGMLGQLGGELGGVAARGVGLMRTVGATGAAVGADLTNQMGIGHPSYHPDFGTHGPPNRRTGGSPPGTQGEHDETSDGTDSPSDGQQGAPDDASGGGQPPGTDPWAGSATPPVGASSSSSPSRPPVGPAQPSPPDGMSRPGARSPGAPGGSGPVGSAGSGATGAEGAGAAETAAAVPIIPV